MSQAVSAGRALGLAKWALRLLTALCVALFVFYVVSSASDPWVSTSAYRALTDATVFPNIGQADKKGLARVSEQRQYSSAVWFLWGLTFIAALLAILLRRLCAVEMARRKDADGGPAEILEKHPGWLAGFKSAVKRVLHYQLPPRRFWFWWCDGFQVYDAVVVAVWVAVNVYYVEQRTSRMLRMTRYEHFHTDDPDKHQTTGQLYLDFISGALAWAATLDIMLLFFPVPRSTFLHYLLGTGFSSLIKYHRWLGHGTMVLLTLHGWGFWALWIWQGEAARGVGWQPQGTNMLAGAISWLCGAALWVTATSYVRRNYFEVFYRTHILGFLGFIIFGNMHRTNLWAFVTPALALYLLDITFRIAQQAYPVRLQMSSVDSTGQLAQLHIGVDSFTPLHPIQEMYISAWKLSPLQWHPFTAIPGQHPSTLLSIIKRYGRWTEDLMSRLQRGGEVAVRVDGPYGEAEGAPDYIHYPVLAVFAGGIGVTPVLGIIQDLNRRRAALRKGQTMLPIEAHLIFAGRSLAELDLLQGSIINESRAAGWLQVQLYQSGKAPPPGPEHDPPAQQSPGSGRSELYASSAASSTSSEAVPSYARRTMPPYSFGDAHWAAAHVLCLVGAVLGSVAAWDFAAAARRNGGEGANEWLVGLVLLAASSIGCMLLPALIIFPAHWWRALALRRRSSKTADADPLPDMPIGCTQDMEQAVPRLSISKGRPDVHSLLADIARSGAKHREIGVIAAGPEPLVNSVKQACAAHNTKVGWRGGRICTRSSTPILCEAPEGKVSLPHVEAHLQESASEAWCGAFSRMYFPCICCVAARQGCSSGRHCHHRLVSSVGCSSGCFRHCSRWQSTRAGALQTLLRTLLR